MKTNKRIRNAMILYKEVCAFDQHIEGLSDYEVLSERAAYFIRVFNGLLLRWAQVMR